MKSIILLLMLFSIGQSHAQESNQTASTTQLLPNPERFPRNSVVLAPSSQMGILFTYSFQFSLSQSLGFLVAANSNVNHHDSSGGDLATDKYIEEDSKTESKSLGLSHIYFFSDVNHRGLFLNTSLSLRTSQYNYHWNRYGTYNGTFFCFGSCSKTLLESRSSEDTLQNTVLQALLGYEWPIHAGRTLFHFYFSAGPYVASGRDHFETIENDTLVRHDIDMKGFAAETAVRFHF